VESPTIFGAASAGTTFRPSPTYTTLRDVTDRQAGIHARDGRPSDAFAAFCGQLKIGWHFCEPADPQAKGAVERLQGHAETNFEPGRCFANELDYQDQLDGWFAKVNARTHKTLRERPADRLRNELELMARLPEAMPDTARRWVTRVAPDPYRRCTSTRTGAYGARRRAGCPGAQIAIRAVGREVLGSRLLLGPVRGAGSGAGRRATTRG
jgi:hypothetical protein